MIDGKTQEVQVQDSEASRSFGEVLVAGFGPALDFARTITRGAQLLLARNAGLHPVLVPVPVPVPHPDRPPGLGASRS